MKIVAAIDTEKVYALLGKTEEGKIVRKRLVNITLKNTENIIEVSSKINLAESDEATYSEENGKSWSLIDLETFVYECPSTGTPLPLTDIGIEFIDDTIMFTSTAAPSGVPNHIVLLLTHLNTAHEIHIDRRTGLTYEIKGK